MNIFLINLKVKIKKNLILLGLFYALFGYTQHSNSEQIYTNGKGLTSIDLRSKELVGTSYFDETFLPAKLSNNEVNKLTPINKLTNIETFDFRAGGNQGFSILAGYIFGNNKRNEKMSSLMV